MPEFYVTELYEGNFQLYEPDRPTEEYRIWCNGVQVGTICRLDRVLYPVSEDPDIQAMLDSWFPSWLKEYEAERREEERREAARQHQWELDRRNTIRKAVGLSSLNTL